MELWKSIFIILIITRINRFNRKIKVFWRTEIKRISAISENSPDVLRFNENKFAQQRLTRNCDSCAKSENQSILSVCIRQYIYTYKTERWCRRVCRIWRSKKPGRSFVVVTPSHQHEQKLTVLLVRMTIAVGRISTQVARLRLSSDPHFATSSFVKSFSWAITFF